MRSFFVIDVESIGLHGEAFAVAGGVYLENGSPQWEFRFCVNRDKCKGNEDSRKWVDENVPMMEITHSSRVQMMNDFWVQWERAKRHDAVMAADCCWPVEAKFLEECCALDDSREFKGPYPLLDIASIRFAAGLDPIGNAPREASELPVHDPLCDARQSARLLSEYFTLLP